MLPASRFYRAVRQFAVQTKVWEDAIRFQTTPEDRWDLTLVSQKVYGNRNEYLAVMAAAGLDTVNQELTERLLVLPTRARLEVIKAETGYSSSTPVAVR